jgi:hypothetical protein
MKGLNRKYKKQRHGFTRKDKSVNEHGISDDKPLYLSSETRYSYPVART